MTHKLAEIEGALATLERSILPDLACLIESLLESAGAARPGLDAAAHAARLREQADQVAALTQFVTFVTERQPQPSRKISA
jgi:hypothetical protein